MVTKVVMSAICPFLFVQSFKGFDDPLAEFETTFQEVVKRLRQKFRYLHFLPGHEQSKYLYNVQSLTNVAFNNLKLKLLFHPYTMSNHLSVDLILQQFKYPW